MIAWLRQILANENLVICVPDFDLWPVKAKIVSVYANANRGDKDSCCEIMDDKMLILQEWYMTGSFWGSFALLIAASEELQKVIGLPGCSVSVLFQVCNQGSPTVCNFKQKYKDI